jgi:hypothetical protein
MSEDRDRDGPSLEPPSLFGRKRKKAPPTPVAPVAPVEPVEPVEPVASVEPVEPVASVEPVEPVESVDPDTIFDDTTEPTVVSPLTPRPAPATPREPRPPREPWLTGRPAAILTGLVVGGLIVAATAGSLRFCTEIKGTSSCGGQGFFLLVAILVAAVVIGAAMLRFAQVPEPGSTSFLAVGLLSVAALLFLVGSIFQWWMAIVIPLVSMAAFLLSHWVTSTYADPANDASDPELEPAPHDVR